MTDITYTLIAWRSGLIEITSNPYGEGAIAVAVMTTEDALNALTNTLTDGVVDIALYDFGNGQLQLAVGIDDFDDRNDADAMEKFQAWCNDLKRTTTGCKGFDDIIWQWKE